MESVGKYFDFNMFTSLKEIVDPEEIALQIRKKGLVRSNVFNDWMSYKDSGEIWQWILNHIEAYLSYQQLCEILWDSGYQNIALQFSQSRRFRKLLNVHDTPKSSFIDPNPEEIFITLKTKAYNKTLTLSRGNLKDRLTRYTSILDRTSDHEKRMQIADKLAYSLCAGIDTVIMTFKMKDPVSHEWFTKLKDVIKDTTNTELFTVAYQSRLAIGNATIGSLEEAETHLSAALSESFSLDGCLVIINLFYFAVYIKGCEFENTPTKDVQNEILKYIDMGLKTLESRADEERKFWKKMYIQRKIFCYLGLSNKARPILNYDIEKMHMDIAKKLLTELFQMFQTMDDRRKQLYWVAKARLAQLQGFENLALKYLDNALDLDIDEEFGETRHIREYKSCLNDYALFPESTSNARDMDLQSEAHTPDNVCNP